MRSGFSPHFGNFNMVCNKLLVFGHAAEDHPERRLAGYTGLRNSRSITLFFPYPMRSLNTLSFR
jgi:hypothetical protein